MSAEDNRALFLRIVEELKKGGKSFVAKAPEFYADDIILHDAHSQEIRGLHDYIERHVKHFFDAFPDFSVVVEDIVAEGDRVVGRLTITGTQSGQIHHDQLDLYATNKKVRIEAVYIERISGGKIVEEWEKQDTAGVLQQLGFILTPPKSDEKM